MQTQSLEKLSTANRLLALFENDPDLDELDGVLVRFVEAYSRDLQHITGADVGYVSDFDRLSTLKDAIRSTGVYYERIAELAEELGSMPSGARSLLTYLNSATLDLASVIRGIESLYPQFDVHEASRYQFTLDSK